MDPVSAIVGALIAGAAATAKDTASQAVKDAYQGLKRVIIDVYKVAAVPLLEKNPHEPAFKDAVEKELRTTKDIESHERVLKLVNQLQDALLAEPAPTLKSWGVKIKEIKAGKDVILTRISGAAGGAQVGKIRATGTVRLSDIHGGGAPRKK